MVAKIIISKNISKALNYNEKKVQKGDAACIHAEQFFKLKEDLSFYDKLERFTELIQRNSRAKSNSLHISLNFDPSEKLSEKRLIEISRSYMKKIGFADQPYLVYQHHDAGHPHVHIVTTNIRSDGSRINTHNIGRNQSEVARKEIEKEFGLIEATGKKIYQLIKIEGVDPEKVIYGKSETKRAITNVLDKVIRQYKYTSLPELNAILKQYNVIADRGHESSRTYKHGGLAYRVLDASGNKVGIPIKASSIHSKPTLKNLEKLFAGNEDQRKPHRLTLKTKIDEAINKSASLETFIYELLKKGIYPVFRQNDKGVLYGITFVDNKTRCVFNGSDLGKEYSASPVLEKLQLNAWKQILQKQSEDSLDSAKLLTRESKQSEKAKDNSPEKSSSKSNDLLYLLLKPESNTGQVPYELIKKKRKKKKRRLGL